MKVQVIEHYGCKTGIQIFSGIGREIRVYGDPESGYFMYRISFNSVKKIAAFKPKKCLK